PHLSRGPDRDVAKGRKLKLFWILCVAALGREVAITIDDLPAARGEGSFDEVRAMTARLLAPFREQRIPVTGFVNPGRTKLNADELRTILNLWIDAGAELGNHTWSHVDLNTTSSADYEVEITRADAALRLILEARGKKLEF